MLSGDLPRQELAIAVNGLSQAKRLRFPRLQQNRIIREPSTRGVHPEREPRGAADSVPPQAETPACSQPDPFDTEGQIATETPGLFLGTEILPARCLLRMTLLAGCSQEFFGMGLKGI